MKPTSKPPRPILKWAGGKGQLLTQIEAVLPAELRAGQVRRYVEPFIGGGAVFFHLAQNFALDEVYLSDVNEELILLYRVAQTETEALIEYLRGVEATYFALTPAAQKDYFYATRAHHNLQRPAIDFETPSAAWVERAAQIVFLNRTGFNGLFRVNAKGEFNVPFGDYKNPRLCDADNLRAVAACLRHVHLRRADFETCAEWVTPETFVYFDPPYRPLSATASFTAYSRFSFNDDAQRQLAHLFRRLDQQGARLMLSNSDPQQIDPADTFFEDLYRGFHLRRVIATRAINAKANGRGVLRELLITNY